MPDEDDDRPLMLVEAAESDLPARLVEQRELTDGDEVLLGWNRLELGSTGAHYWWLLG
jgi:hypothetical protein